MTEQIEKWKSKIPKSVLTASILAIAIGQVNDTLDVLNKSYNLVLSVFTDIPSDKKLSHIYINASANILSETFGSPVYIKKTTESIQVNYYRDSNYLLSAITENNGIVAFLVFPIDGYVPEMQSHTASEGYDDKSFDTYSEVMDSHSNIANIGSYYIEEIRGGQFDLLYKSVVGSSDYLGKYSDTDYKVLIKFNDQLMMEEDLSESLKAVRETLKPNFYGYSKISLSQLEQGILSASEYKMLTQ